MDGHDVKTFYADFGRLVRAARDKAGVTQTQLAQRIGLTRSSVANLEAGRQKVLLHVLVGIAETLGIDEIEILPERHPRKALNLAKLDAEASHLPAEDRDFVMATVRAARMSEGGVQ